MQNIKLVFVFVATCALAGCDRSSSTPNTNDNKSTAQPAKSTSPATPPAAAAKPATTPAATQPVPPTQPPAAPKPATEPAQPPAAKPAAPPAVGGHGPAMELGTVSVGGYQLKVVQSRLVVAGRAADFDVFVVGGEGKPAAIRLWIGSEDGTGARKLKATFDKAGAHNHVPAGNPIPEGAKLCVEVELPNGDKQVGSLAYKS